MQHIYFDNIINILIIITVFVLSFTISTFIHEFGHYITARLFGIIPKEFIIGSKIKFFKRFNRFREYNKFGTNFILNPFSTSGYVEGKDCLEKLSKFKMILVIFAGPLFNLLLTFILLNYVYFMYSESNDSLQENILTFLNFAQVNIKVFFEIPIFGLSSISLLLTIFLIYINIFEFFINLFPIKTTDGYLILKRYKDNILSENLNSELRESIIQRE